MLDDDDIVALVRGDESVEEPDERQPSGPKVTAKEAIESIDKLVCFFTETDGNCDITNSFLVELKNVKKKLSQSIIDSRVQTDITSFISVD